MAAVADRPCDLFASSPPLVPAPPPRAMLHDPYEGISLTVDAQEWHRLDVDRALMWTRVRVLSNQASFALRVRVRPPDGERLPDKLALKATLVVDRQGGKDTGAGKDAASAAAFTKPHLLVSEAGEAPLLLDAPPGRHSRAALLPAAPVMVVNGPIRDRIGMNMKLGALGAGNRANATIGRALRLVVRNVGGASTGGVERSTLGNPMKFTMCFAEWEERAPWEPLHVERGFDREDSVVTVFAMTGGPVHIVDQTSRSPEQIAGSLGMGLEGVFLPKMHNLPIDALLVICPEHIDTLMRDGAWDKDRLRDRIQQVTSRPLREMLADDRSGAGILPAAAAGMTPEMLDRPAPKFAGKEYIHIVVAGSDAGKFSSAFHGWATGEVGSISVSRKIDLG